MVISDIAALGTTILHSLWQATLLAGVLWLVSRRRKLPARLRYALAYGTLLLQCVLSIGTFLYYRSPNAHLEAGFKQAFVDFVAAGPAVAPAQRLLYTPDFWMAALVSCWFLGMLIGSLKLSVSLWQVRSMRYEAVTEVTRTFARHVRELADRMAYNGPLHLRASKRITTPMLVGHLKPILLFPVAMVNQLSTQESETVILHELAHLRRQDHWFNLLQCLIEVVFYYHPAVHWIGARIREEREHCCDDLVLRYGPGRLPYARALLHFSRATSGTSLTLSLTDGGGLLSRVRRFIDQQEKSYKMKSRILLLPLLAAFVMVATAAYVPTGEGSVVAELPREDLTPALAALNPVIYVDTLPQGTHQITRISDGKTTRLRVEDGEIKELELEGNRIPEEDFPQYEEKAEEILGIDNGRNDQDMNRIRILHPMDFRGEDSVRIYRSMSALRDLDIDLDLPLEALENSLAAVKINFDSLSTQFKTLRFDAMDGDIFLDKELENMDSIYTRSLDGMRIYRHRLEDIENIENLEALKAKEEVLQEALKQLERRKKQLRERENNRGEAMIEQVRARREAMMARARETREALQQRRNAPAIRINCPESSISHWVEEPALAFNAPSVITTYRVETSACAPAVIEESVEVKVEKPEPIIYHEFQGEAFY